MDIGKYFSEGWKIVSSDYITWILAGLLIAVSDIVPILLTAPITIGFFAMALKAARGEKAQLGDIGSGFSRYFDGILAYLFVLIIVAVGLLLLVIPGLIFLVWYMYTPIVLADKKCGFSEAMSESKRIAKKNFWGTFLLGIVVILVNIIGGALIVLWVITLPLSLIAVALAYRELQAS